MVQSLHAVALLVPDYDAAIAFYVTTLGFDLLQDVALEDGKRWIEVRPPEAAHGSLILAKAVGVEQSAAIGNQTGGRVGFFLVTDDFGRDHAAMLANGVTFEAAPRIAPYGTVVVWQDPFGNRWDLIEWAES